MCALKCIGNTTPAWTPLDYKTIKLENKYCMEETDFRFLSPPPLSLSLSLSLLVCSAPCGRVGWRATDESLRCSRGPPFLLIENLPEPRVLVFHGLEKIVVGEEA